jgi:hypothetical protein
MIYKTLVLGKVTHVDCKQNREKSRGQRYGHHSIWYSRIIHKMNMRVDDTLKLKRKNIFQYEGRSCLYLMLWEVEKTRTENNWVLRDGSIGDPYIPSATYNNRIPMSMTNT